MNFHFTTVDSGNYLDLDRVHLDKNWFLYLDKGWIKKENYFFKGAGSSWCKIFVAPTIKIETNKLRDFPIYYSNTFVSNIENTGKSLPVDGRIEIEDSVKVSYEDKFYYPLSNVTHSFNDCVDMVYDLLVENVLDFSRLNGNKKVYIPEQGGIDTLTARSVFDHLEIEYETFNLPKDQPKLSKLGRKLVENNWGFQQVHEQDNSVTVTGFYGDEWILRNPYYVHILLSNRGINLTQYFDETPKCYMKEYFEHYRSKCSEPSRVSVEELRSQMCNDFQIWHLHSTLFFSPLKMIQLQELLCADTDTIIGQVTNAEISRELIRLFNPKLLDKIDNLKNQNDPTWFPNS